MRNISMKATVRLATGLIAGVVVLAAGAPAQAAATKNTNTEKVA